MLQHALSLIPISGLGYARFRSICDQICYHQSAKRVENYGRQRCVVGGLYLCGILRVGRFFY